MVCIEKKMKVLICKFGDWYAYVCDNDYLLIELGSQQKFEKLSPKRVNTLISKIKDLKKKRFHIEAICGKRINNEILKIILKRYISYISGEIKVENLYVLKDKTVGDLINEIKPKPKKLTDFEIKLIEEELLQGAKDSPYFIDDVIKPAINNIENDGFKIKNYCDFCDIDSVGDDSTIEITELHDEDLLDLINGDNN